MKNNTLITKNDWLSILLNFAIGEQNNYSFTNVNEVGKVRACCTRLKKRGLVFTTATNTESLIIKRTA
jgi:hypothetical protein